MNIQAYSYNDSIMKKIITIFLTILIALSYNLVGTSTFADTTYDEWQAELREKTTENNQAFLDALPTDVKACPDIDWIWQLQLGPGTWDKETFEIAENIVNEVTDENDTDTEKAVALVNWTANALTYSNDFTQHSKDFHNGESCENPTKCILKGDLTTGSCQEHQAVYYCLLTAAKVPNAIVNIRDIASSSGHAINAVLLDGKWYYVDPLGSHSVEGIKTDLTGWFDRVRTISFINYDKYFNVLELDNPEESTQWTYNFYGGVGLKFRGYVHEHEHVFTEDPVSITEPTCCSEGEMVYQCTLEPEYCQKKRVVKLPEIDHVYEKTPYLTRTADMPWDGEEFGAIHYNLQGNINPHYCVNDTLSFYHCSNPKCNSIKCEITESDAIITKTETPATCTKSGYITYTCSKCDWTTKEYTTDALGHDVQLVDEKGPTCTENGYEIYQCSRCEYWYRYSSISATGHKYVETSHTNATCANPYEVTTYTCSTCEDVKTDRKYASVNHTPGNPEHGTWGSVFCKVCGTYMEFISQPTQPTVSTTPKVTQPLTTSTVSTSKTTQPTTTKVTTTTQKTVKLKTPAFKLKSGKKLFKVTYKKVSGANGFQVRYTIGKKTYTKAFNSAKSVTKTIKNLKKGTYKVKIRAFTKQDDKTTYSSWSKIKSVKVK